VFQVLLKNMVLFEIKLIYYPNKSPNPPASSSSTGASTFFGSSFLGAAFLSSLPPLAPALSSFLSSTLAATAPPVAGAPAPTEDNKVFILTVLRNLSKNSG